MIKEKDLAKAIDALTAEGHQVRTDDRGHNQGSGFRGSKKSGYDNLER
jgi:hypothetical protein